MRLTVGPLPPAVYWRRRAVVLGAVLLSLIVLIYSCNGPDDTKEAGTDPSGNATPSAGPTILTPETGAPESGAPESGAPESGAPTADPSGAPPDGTDPQVEEAGGPPGSGPLPPPAPPVENECADDEMSVIPVASQTSMQRGQTIQLRIRIKNVSDRTCNRDVGADVQEIYLKAGATTIWSSDVCSEVRGNNVKSFPPYHEEEFGLPWNGRRSSGCENGSASGDPAPAGTYQLFGRLGDKRSDPVKLTITN